ncbi:hypothetical protein SLS58_007077 [Diplodia intermedia]|uniref:Uncharacterized protein n=1 Tax=Diplodia intermedia TaxID=856260 RepID=A0ABR3TL75_9PEZI
MSNSAVKTADNATDNVHDGTNNGVDAEDAQSQDPAGNPEDEMDSEDDDNGSSWETACLN